MVVFVFIELAFSRTGTGRRSSVETALLEFRTSSLDCAGESHHEHSSMLVAFSIPGTRSMYSECT